MSSRPDGDNWSTAAIDGSVQNPASNSEARTLPDKEKHDKPGKDKESREQKKKRQDQVLIGVGSQFDSN